MTAQTVFAAPGWYPDGHGSIRFFDGTAWTQHTQPAQAPGPPAADTVSAPAGSATDAAIDKPFYREGWFFVDIAFVVLIVGIIAYASLT